jgi:type IV secretory pathway TrbD component
VTVRPLFFFIATTLVSLGFQLTIMAGHLQYFGWAIPWVWGIWALVWIARFVNFQKVPRLLRRYRRQRRWQGRLSSKQD